MKYTLIWLSDETTEKSDVTVTSLLKLQEKEKITLIWDTQKREENTELAQKIEEQFGKSICCDFAGENPAAQANQALTKAEGDYVTWIFDGDTLSDDFFTEIELAAAEAELSFPVIMTRKQSITGEADAFSGKRIQSGFVLMDMEKQFSIYPYFLGGTLLKTDYIMGRHFDETLPYDYEKKFVLPVVMESMTFPYFENAFYTYAKPRESSSVFYPGIYEEGWYREPVTKFWPDFLKTTKELLGEIPEFAQYFALYCLSARFKANINNTNKHLIPEEEAYAYMLSYHAAFAFLEDDVLLNARKINAIGSDITLQQLFLKIKYQDEDLQFEQYIFQSKAYLGFGRVLKDKVANQTVNIKYMEYKNKRLEIDGSVSSILDLNKGQLYVRKDEERFNITWDEIYSLTKCFGVSYTKRKAFHISIPIEDLDRQAISFIYRLGSREWKLIITYQSHFSRLTKTFKNSYWNINNHLMARHVKGDIVIYKISKKSVVKREVQLLFEMFKSRKKYSTKYAWYRILSRLYGAFYKNKKIWLYIDKIYKAGDSSEYIYKYAEKQKDPQIKNYYLVDKTCPDYRRMKKEGYKPLVRGTLKHRMLFLLADLITISNSTVFAYNDYDLSTSEYIRDIVKFKVSCVQHGMSVQKIAIAQNRLRDNISLYFCASPYEIKNLSKPVYGYTGYDILKLTGVPRYDGLVNRDKKQILLAPTWRMQAAVPVTKNESVARDYNPLFKESMYYKIYNSLINDTRLIDAAKKYGYRIAYVLHPIVSPQVEDFEKNDYVDIIPAIGDMSYEKVFCESSLMVTDFSGVQFDFAYMRKPVVYLHHRDIPEHYEEGTFFYDTMGFGEICHDNEELINKLCEYMADECKMKEEYRRRADDFFAFNDHNNCERIYEVMKNYK